MRELNVDIITQNIKEMCIEANHFLTDDMKKVFKNAVATEESPLGKKVLNQLNENLDIAGNDMIPICQDTGMAVIFINVGQEVHFTNGNITDAINEGVRQGYVDGYLRKSVVSDPIIRENTKDNTPAVIHYNIVEGDKVDITVAPKGFGSENMSSNLNYTKTGDYFLPNLTLNQPRKQLNRYGRMRRNYLMEQRPVVYSTMLLNGTLYPHLWEVEQTAENRMQQLMKELLERNPAPDKEKKQMAWVQHMNSLKAQAEEMILTELIYS